jgi:hypothetical protein
MPEELTPLDPRFYALSLTAHFLILVIDIAIWRLGARNEKLCNACGQYNKKWNGLNRPVALFPNTQTPTLRK